MSSLDNFYDDIVKISVKLPKHRYTGTFWKNFYSLYFVIIFACHDYLCQIFFFVIEIP